MVLPPAERTHAEGLVSLSLRAVPKVTGDKVPGDRAPFTEEEAVAEGDIEYCA